MQQADYYWYKLAIVFVMASIMLIIVVAIRIKKKNDLVKEDAFGLLQKGCNEKIEIFHKAVVAYLEVFIIDKFDRQCVNNLILPLTISEKRTQEWIGAIYDYGGALVRVSDLVKVEKYRTQLYQTLNYLACELKKQSRNLEKYYTSGDPEYLNLLDITRHEICTRAEDAFDQVLFLTTETVNKKIVTGA